MRPAFLFDLDGTLIDSIELILGSARHAFAGFAGRAPSDEEWRTGIGRPLQTVLREYAADDSEADRLFQRYRAYQLEHHARLVRPYEGIVDAVRWLGEAGHPMALVTSKADWLAEKALVHVGLENGFDRIEVRGTECPFPDELIQLYHFTSSSSSRTGAGFGVPLTFLIRRPPMIFPPNPTVGSL